MKTQLKPRTVLSQFPKAVAIALSIGAVLTVVFKTVHRKDGMATDHQEPVYIKGQIHGVEPTKVYLYGDVNANGILDQNDIPVDSTTTDETGSYTFQIDQRPLTPFEYIFYLNNGRSDYEQQQGELMYSSEDLDFNDHPVFLNFGFLEEIQGANLSDATLVVTAAEEESGRAVVAVKEPASEVQTSWNFKSWKTNDTDSLNVQLLLQSWLDRPMNQNHESTFELSFAPLEGIDDRDALSFEKDPEASYLIVKGTTGNPYSHFIVTTAIEVMTPPSWAFDLKNSEPRYFDFYPRVDPLRILEFNGKFEMDEMVLKCAVDGSIDQIQVIELTDLDTITLVSDWGRDVVSPDGVYEFRIDHQDPFSERELILIVGNEQGQIDRRKTVVSERSLQFKMLKFGPNPCQSTLNLEWYASQSSTLLIHDLTGNLVASWPMEMGQGSKSIETGHWRKGAYILSVPIAGFNQKIIKN